MKSLTLICALICLTGCQHWPDEADLGNPNLSADEIDTAALTQSPPTAALKHWLIEQQTLLAGLEARGAERCLPAQVKRIQSTHHRIYREIGAELFKDASNDLAASQDYLGTLRYRLDYLHKKGACFYHETSVTHVALSKTEDHSAVARNLENLLNCNSRFVSDSAELLPRYAFQLDEAGQLLKQNPNLVIHLTGHTDKNGTSASNNELGMARANAVKARLLQNGMPADNVVINTTAQPSPGSDHSPVLKLDERRVDAKVSLPRQTADPATGSNEDSATGLTLSNWYKRFDIKPLGYSNKSPAQQRWASENDYTE